MERRKAIGLAAGLTALVAVAAAAFALTPERSGRLASLDLDGDGQIVGVEIQRSARQRFAELDSNSDGRLTGEELPRGRHGRGRRGPGPHDQLGPTSGEPAATATAPPSLQPMAGRRRGWARADSDGDGALTLREFYARHSARAARADSNGDGTISAEEIAAHRLRRDRRRF